MGQKLDLQMRLSSEEITWCGSVIMARLRVSPSLGDFGKVKLGAPSCGSVTQGLSLGPKLLPC